MTKVYGNQSRTRIMSLKECLSSITKCDSNACDYLHSICSVANELALISHSVDGFDLVIVALNDLSPAYREFCAAIHTHDIPLLFDELFDKLVDYEIFLHQEERQQSSFPVTANHVSRLSFFHGCYKRSMSSPSGASLAQDNPSRSNPRNSSSGSLLICQYCDHRDHTAKTCCKLHGYPSNHSRRQANTVKRILALNRLSFWILMHLTMSLGILLISLWPMITLIMINLWLQIVRDSPSLIVVQLFFPLPLPHFTK